MPIYNERATVEEIIERVLAVPLRIELIAVDDASTDGSRDIAARAWRSSAASRLLLQERNQGKGAAVRRGHRRGHGRRHRGAGRRPGVQPRGVPRAARPDREGQGGRGLRQPLHRPPPLLPLHALPGQPVPEPGHQRPLQHDHDGHGDLLQGGARRPAEVAAACAATASASSPRSRPSSSSAGARVYEVPITYEGRDYSEGKKITWRDGFPALWTLIKYRFVD